MNPMLNRSEIGFELPPSWNNIRSWIFVGKLALLAVVLCLGFIMIAWGLPLALLGTFLVGVMFAHAIELQHQCLHGTAFKTRLANRLVGTVLGLPMFVPFTKYRIQHLKHHRDVGTLKDAEFFSYGKRLEDLSFWQLIIRSFSLKRYRQIAYDMLHCLLGRGQKHDKFSEKVRKTIRQEYGIFVGILAFVAITGLLLGNWALFKFWLVPVLFIAEPIHFWIELPEHFRCAKITDSSWTHTRTIQGSLFSYWLTNGNNFHVEHHLFQQLPIDRLPAVHSLIRERVFHFNSSYPGFFRNQVLKAKFSEEKTKGIPC